MGELAAQHGDNAVTPLVTGAITDGHGPYPPSADLPTQSGPFGVRFDFNSGCRVKLPIAERPGDTWRVRFSDRKSGNVLFDTSGLSDSYIGSVKKWYLPFKLEVWRMRGGETEHVLTHELDLSEREVLVQFPIGTLGDTLAWMPYVARFAVQHGARVTCALSGLIRPLLEGGYPNLRFVTHQELLDQGLAETFYATYSLGLFFDDADGNWQPTDFRFVGLHRTAAYILGVDPAESRCLVSYADPGRPIPEPYVCIAVQASTQCKHWNNPFGWDEVVSFLKQKGYRVICIDQRTVYGTGLVWNRIPHGAEDQTGDRSLEERARWLRHSELFVGLSSGLAWLAWSVETPVVMISGFTHPTNEFDTPYRVINWHVCNSCWNDPRHRFQHDDFLWCPRHKGTDRQFECSRSITGQMVLDAVQAALGAVRSSNEGDSLKPLSKRRAI